MREAIYAALFERLNTIPGFVTKSRKLKHWNDVSIAEQPALFQAQTGETVERITGLPAKRMFQLDLYVYVRTEGLTAPTETLNPLLDAIEAVLEPNAVSPAQTLGGLVHSCRIEGAIETDEGTLGDQAVAIIPVLITVS